MIKASEFQEALKLDCLVSSTNDTWDFRTPDLNRPGMQFCGFYEFFAFERPQVIGKVEMSYLEKQSPENRRRILEQYLSYNIPCIVICRDLTPPPELLELAEKHRIFVFRTSAVTSRFTVAAIHYLNRCLAPHVVRHGILLDVYGVGVLLTGKSGVGKSEAALELIKRGHRLVSDDVVEIKKVSDDTLFGSAPDVTKHLIELRGIGIIDVKTLYGVQSVKETQTIDLVIQLEEWDREKEYDRLGLEEKYTEFLGNRVVCNNIPIRPGRNLAIICEAAAINYRQKKMGYNAALELQKRVTENLMKLSGGGME